MILADQAVAATVVIRVVMIRGAAGQAMAEAAMIRPVFGQACALALRRLLLQRLRPLLQSRIRPNRIRRPDPILSPNLLRTIRP